MLLLIKYIAQDPKLDTFLSIVILMCFMQCDEIKYISISQTLIYMHKTINKLAFLKNILAHSVNTKM